MAVPNLAPCALTALLWYHELCYVSQQVLPMRGALAHV